MTVRHPPVPQLVKETDIESFLATVDRLAIDDPGGPMPSCEEIAALGHTVSRLIEAHPEVLDDPEIAMHVQHFLDVGLMLKYVISWLVFLDPTTGEIPPMPPPKPQVDRPRSHFDDPMGGTLVYVAYDAAGQVLYVGVTDELFARMAQHRRQSRWWDRMERLTWEEWPDRETALRQETRLIGRYRPPFNTVGNPDRVPRVRG